MKEQIYQSKIIKDFENRGYYVVNLIKTNKNGIPDLMALKEGRNPIFIECKKPNGVVSELQYFRLKELNSKGFEVYISRGYELNPYLESL